jgi:hypothetical protein
MIHGLIVPAAAPPRRDGHAQFGTITAQDAQELLAMGAAHVPEPCLRDLYFGLAPMAYNSCVGWSSLTSRRLLFSSCEGLSLDGDVRGVGTACTFLERNEISATAVGG